MRIAEVRDPFLLPRAFDPFPVLRYPVLVIMKSTRGYSIVLVTDSSLASARKIAAAALDQRLVACASIIPGIESHYTWKGKKERSKEVLILFKTRRSCLTKLEKLVRSLHSYETPEFITLPIQSGSRAYLQWLADSTS